MAQAASVRTGPRRWTRARSSFRDWRKSRPFWGGVWTLIGGAIITYIPATAWKFSFIAGNLVWAGVLVGALIVAMGLLLWFQAHLRVVIGVVTILLSLVSFFTSDFGGFFVGMLLGLLGGSLAIGWMPEPPLSRRERRRQRTLHPEPAVIDITDRALDLVRAGQREPDAIPHHGGRHRR